MQNLLSNLKITINDKLYVKDPETSELGRNILKNSIILIDEIGFEAFTFKNWVKKFNLMKVQFIVILKTNINY